jgi:hypothetical protein
MRFKPPYGLSGDRLWVKETYCQTDDGIVYRADVKPNDDEDTARIMRDYGYVWKSGRFMPRSASRILLEITSVRAERLQDITPQDVYREGLEPELTYGVDVDINGELWLSGIRKVKAAFRPLWDSINGEKPGCSWEENPAVWVYGFKRIDTGKTTPKE